MQYMSILGVGAYSVVHGCVNIREFERTLLEDPRGM